MINWKADLNHAMNDIASAESRLSERRAVLASAVAVVIPAMSALADELRPHNRVCDIAEIDGGGRISISHDSHPSPYVIEITGALRQRTDLVLEMRAGGRDHLAHAKLNSEIGEGPLHAVRAREDIIASAMSLAYTNWLRTHLNQSL
jgi:hypothetical protein